VIVHGQPAVRVCDDCPNPDLAAARTAAHEAQQAQQEEERLSQESAAARLQAQTDASERQPRVFLSCAADAKPLTEALAEFLRSKGRVNIRSGGDTVASCGTFVYVASPQWLEALKQPEAEDNVCREELKQALAAHAEPAFGTALVPVLHADCGGFPSTHILQIDAALRQAFSFTFVSHHVKPKHYRVFLEELLERIDGVNSVDNLRRKVFLSHKQLDCQDFVRIIACWLDRLGVSYFLDVDHLLGNHDLKALTAKCDYFVFVKSAEWLKDVQLPLPESEEEEQHKLDYPEAGQFEGKHWVKRHRSCCRQELTKALEVHADDLSKLVPIHHKSFSDELSAQVPPDLAVAMEQTAVDHHVGGKHFELFIQELLERMKIDVQALLTVAEAQASGIPRDLISTDDLAASMSLTPDMIERVMSSSTSEHSQMRTGSTGSTGDDAFGRTISLSKTELAAEVARLKTEAAKVASLEAQLQKTREHNHSLQTEPSSTDSDQGGGEGQAQLLMSAENTSEANIAADFAIENAELRSQLAEHEASLALLAPAAAAALSAGLVSASDLAGGGGGTRGAEQGGRLMPSGERAELERELKELLAADASLSLGGRVMSEMSLEQLRDKVTELHPTFVAADDLL